MSFIEHCRVQDTCQVARTEIVDSIPRVAEEANMIDTTMVVTTGDIVITREVTATARHSSVQTMVVDSELTYIKSKTDN